MRALLLTDYKQMEVAEVDDHALALSAEDATFDAGTAAAVAANATPAFAALAALTGAQTLTLADSIIGREGNKGRGQRDRCGCTHDKALCSELHG